MLNHLEKQTHASIIRAELPARFIGILTPSEFDEMVEFGFIRRTPDRQDDPFETLTEQLLPKMNRGRHCDSLNTCGTYDLPTFMRRGKKWPQLESLEVFGKNHLSRESTPTHPA
ncbi:MAG: hypothetical protein HQL07_17250 [Nitrospirae bacterium]|nr:hypothetical protein [Magnetococcales bacterium]